MEKVVRRPVRFQPRWPAIAAHDSLNDGQSIPVPRRFFSGEVRVEDPFEGFRIHSVPRITYHQPHVFARWRSGSSRWSTHRFRLPIVSRSHTATGAHCVSGIRAQVHQHLVYLCGSAITTPLSGSTSMPWRISIVVGRDERMSLRASLTWAKLMGLSSCSV